MSTMIKRVTFALATILAVSAGAAIAQVPNPLRVAADATFPPFVSRTAGGQLEGFVIDLIGAVAEELGTEYEFVNQEFSGIFAGLYAGHYDVIIAPTTVTAERAESMAFTEGYVETALGIVTLANGELPALEDLAGKTVAVNSGSTADTWATNNAERFGFEVQRYLKVPDAVQAVLTRRAFAAVSDLGSVAYIAQQQRNLRVANTINTGGVFAYAVKPDSMALRDALDGALECLKQKGVIAELHEKWFGTPAAADSPAVNPFPGHGQPGFNFHEAGDQAPACSS